MRCSAALLLLVPLLAATALVVVRGGREAGWRVLPDGTRVRISTPRLADRTGDALGLPLGSGESLVIALSPSPPGIARARADLHLLSEAVLRFYFAEGRVPGELAELERPDPGGTLYVETIPRDPWGRAYVYDSKPSIRTAPTYRLSCQPPGGSHSALSITSNAEAFTSDR